jgi:hypothetical protein
MMTSKDAKLYLEDESKLSRLGCESKTMRRDRKRRKDRLQSKEVELLKTGKGLRLPRRGEVAMHDFIDILRVVAWPLATVLSVWLAGRAISRAAFINKRM